ncbi:EamA family transporter [Janibacter sp. GXQ6167]|uniref:EamA family transporter n=1 Tax=Janibacter sp. GXQ6167 TaxID=3240791 RepID=UPI00352566B4
MTVLLALGSSVVWGTSDFVAGLLSRRVSPWVVMVWSQLIGLLIMTVAVIVRGAGIAPGAWLGWAAAAAIAGSAGLGCFYSALASGTMGVVAPIASLGVAVPVLLGVIGGDVPSATAWVGMAAAIVGVVLASGPEIHGDAGPRPVLLASAAGVGFGLALYFLHRAARDSLLHALFGMRLTTVVVAVVIVLGWWLVRHPAGSALRPETTPAALLGLGVVGAADLGANALFAAASTTAMVSVASVLGSLYSVVTAGWARLILGERLRPIQLLGVALVVLGVVLIAL